MKGEEQVIYKQLHKLEDELIQLKGLMNALQLLPNDRGASICLMNVISERFQILQNQFYLHWETILRK